MADKDVNERARVIMEYATGDPLEKIGPNTTLAQLGAKAFLMYTLGDKEPIQFEIFGGVVTGDTEKKKS